MLAFRSVFVIFLYWSRRRSRRLRHVTPRNPVYFLFNSLSYVSLAALLTWFLSVLYIVLIFFVDSSSFTFRHVGVVVGLGKRQWRLVLIIKFQKNRLYHKLFHQKIRFHRDIQEYLNMKKGKKLVPTPMYFSGTDIDQLTNE